jgi:hypothetical protein
MHDVFVVQVHGSKRWGLASQPYSLPLRNQPYNKSLPDPEPEQEFELCRGDVMYLPRGTIHWGRTNTSASVHITMGVHPVLWSDLIANAIRRLAIDDVRFRQALPVGFASDESRRDEILTTAGALMETVRARLSPDALVDAALTQATSITWPTLRHHLTDLEKIDHVQIDTRVRRRPEQRWRLTTSDELVTLSFHDKAVELPARVADAVKSIAASNGDGFTGRDIRGDLDELGRVVLMKALLREGFLTLG